MWPRKSQPYLMSAPSPSAWELQWAVKGWNGKAQGCGMLGKSQRCCKKVGCFPLILKVCKTWFKCLTRLSVFLGLLQSSSQVRLLLSGQFHPGSSQDTAVSPLKRCPLTSWRTWWKVLHLLFHGWPPIWLTEVFMYFLAFYKPQTSGHTATECHACSVLCFLTPISLAANLPCSKPWVNLFKLCIRFFEVCVGLWTTGCLIWAAERKEILLTAQSFQSMVAARLHAVGCLPFVAPGERRGDFSLPVEQESEQNKIGQGCHGL